jgi:predicted transcriptional regulator
VSIDGIISPPHKLILIIPDADVISILTEKVSGELEMLERHLLILKQVVENEPIGILKLAEETNIPSHKVRYSLRVLEQEGLIKASAPGAVTTEQTVLFLEELEGMIEDLSRRSEELKKIKIER